MALPIDLPVVEPLTIALTTGVTAGVTFAVVRAVAYVRLQYITAAMLGRHVPRGGVRMVDLNVQGGKNLYYVPKDVIQVVALDYADNRLVLENQAIQAGVPTDIRRTNSNGSWPLLSGTMDAVVSVDFLCEMPEDRVARILAEAARVLKPGKPFIFVESIDASNGMLKAAQKMWWGVLSRFGKGEHYLGNVMEVIQASEGFEGLESDQVLGFQDPHVVGVMFRSQVPQEAPNKPKSSTSSASSRFGKDTREAKRKK